MGWQYFSHFQRMPLGNGIWFSYHKILEALWKNFPQFTREFPMTRTFCDGVPATSRSDLPTFKGDQALSAQPPGKELERIQLYSRLLKDNQLRGLYSLVYNFWQMNNLSEILCKANQVIYLKDPVGAWYHHYPEDLSEPPKQVTTVLDQVQSGHTFKFCSTFITSKEARGIVRW